MGVFSEGVLTIRALLFGGCIRAPDFWNPFMCRYQYTNIDLDLDVGRSIDALHVRHPVHVWGPMEGGPMEPKGRLGCPSYSGASYGFP